MEDSKPKLGFADFVLLVISLVIGLGIFSTPAKVAHSAHTPTMFYAVWIIGGIMALCGALVYAELGSLLPERGAYYKIFAKAYHPSVGFAINVLLFFCNAASLAIVALIGAEYCAHLWNIPSSNTLFPVLFSMICITLFLVVNLFGLRTSSTMLNILLLIKMGLMLILVSTLFRPMDAAEIMTIPSVAPAMAEHKNWFQLFLVSLIPVCFTYGGYQQTINFGKDIKSSSYITKGIILGIITVIIFYLLLNLAYVHALGFEGLKHTQAIGTQLFQLWFGEWGGKVFDVLVVLSVLAYTNVLLMSNPLVMHAMAQDGLLPSIFSRQHPKTGAHTIGLLSFYAITMMVVVIGKQVDSIMGFTMFLDSIGMIASAATLFILRKKLVMLPELVQPYHRYTSVLTTLFIVFYMGVASGVVIMDLKAACIGAGLIIGVWGLWYLLFKKTISNL